MKLVVAVSGGVDSVVLLHELVESGGHDLVVAHFDHGMREDSEADARFVAGLAASYGLGFESKREELMGANEDLARERRYRFLSSVAEKYQARIATGHHLDDLVETVALNMLRGTRWRGLAAMSNQGIYRPFLKRTKSELDRIAIEKRLEWCEDETNTQDIYQRNIIRKKLARLPLHEKLEVYDLWQKQREIRQEIEREVQVSDFPVTSRYFVIMVDQPTACELLYEYFMVKHNVSLLKSQVDYLLLAIKTARAGTKWQIGQGVVVRIGRKDWHAEIGE